MTRINVTFNLEPKLYDDFKKLCNDKGVKFSHELESLMSAELSRSLTVEGESMPQYRDEKQKWIYWFKHQDDPTLKEVADKFGLLNIYALAYLSIPSTRREEASFSDYQTALHYAKKVA